MIHDKSIILIYRDLMQGEKFRNPIQAEGKVVIVTGSNTGIGKETALEVS